MAEQLFILSSGAPKTGVARMAERFTADTGMPVDLEFATAPVIDQRLKGGERPDVVVLPPSRMDVWAQHGLLIDGSRGFIGRSRMGLVVRHGQTHPDISTVDALRAALLACEGLVFNDASSGLYTEQLLGKLGIADTLRDRVVRVLGGAAVMDHVAESPLRELGGGQLSEIRVRISKGVAVELVGPLPDAVQNVTPYDAAALKDSKSPEPAKALALLLSSAAAKPVFAATGID